MLCFIALCCVCVLCVRVCVMCACVCVCVSNINIVHVGLTINCYILYKLLPGAYTCNLLAVLVWANSLSVVCVVF